MDVSQLRTLLKKKSLFGYDPNDVKHQYERMQMEIKLEEEALEREYQHLLGENKMLKAKIRELKENHEQENALETRIARQLLFTHIENTNRIMETKEELERFENKTREELDLRRKEKHDLKSKLSDALSYLKTNRS